MDSTTQEKPRLSSGRRGCLILILGALAVMIWAFWQIGEPNRRAHENLAAIQPGMNALEVDGRITGRHYCVYQVQRTDAWEIVTREDFQALISTPSAGAPVKLRMMLTFLGLSPGRVSFFVEVDRDGRVQKATKPYGWD